MENNILKRLSLAASLLFAGCTSSQYVLEQNEVNCANESLMSVEPDVALSFSNSVRKLNENYRMKFSIVDQIHSGRQPEASSVLNSELNDINRSIHLQEFNMVYILFPLMQETLACIEGSKLTQFPSMPLR